MCIYIDTYIYLLGYTCISRYESTRGKNDESCIKWSRQGRRESAVSIVYDSLAQSNSTGSLRI